MKPLLGTKGQDLTGDTVWLLAPSCDHPRARVRCRHAWLGDLPAGPAWGPQRGSLPAPTRPPSSEGRQRGEQPLGCVPPRARGTYTGGTSVVTAGPEAGKTLPSRGGAHEQTHRGTGWGGSSSVPWPPSSFHARVFLGGCDGSPAPGFAGQFPALQLPGLQLWKRWALACPGNGEGQGLQRCSDPPWTADAAAKTPGHHHPDP